MNSTRIAKMIDHTILKATTTKEDVVKICNEAKEHGFFSVCINPANIELAKEELKIFNVLKSDLYYGIKDKDKSSGGQQREAISPEFSDFINSFKNAYSTYKDAIQKGGTEMGLGYVRNDEQFQEMFGQFFNGVGGDQFQKLMNVK